MIYDGVVTMRNERMERKERMGVILVKKAFLLIKTLPVFAFCFWSLVAAEWHLGLVVACYYEIEIFVFFTIPAALVAIPVSFAVGSVFHAVSESAHTLPECSVTECELCIQVAALCRWKFDAHENASLVMCESWGCGWGVKRQ